MGFSVAALTHGIATIIREGDYTIRYRFSRSPPFGTIQTLRVLNQSGFKCLCTFIEYFDVVEVYRDECSENVSRAGITQSHFAFVFRDEVLTRIPPFLFSPFSYNRINRFIRT